MIIKEHKTLSFIFLAILLLIPFTFTACDPDEPQKEKDNINATEGDGKIVSLPQPRVTGDTSVEDAIYNRISRRSFGEESLSLNEIAQLLWAAQGMGVDGITGASRTAPSAGATHPVYIYLIAGKVDNLTPGTYIYEFNNHEIKLLAEGDFRAELAGAALNQSFVAEAPANVVLAVDYDKTTGRYGERGVKYVHMEIGHITQNLYLQAEAIELGGVAVGAFDNDAVSKIPGLYHEPLMIFPVGKR